MNGTNPKLGVGCICPDDVPAPYARALEQQMLPNTEKIIEAVRAVTYNA